MSDQPKLPLGQRFTMLEPRGPNTLLPGSEAWPVVELESKERFTMLEAKGPNSPSQGELEARTGTSQHTELPAEVLNLVAELAAAVAALDYITSELPKRTPG